jgi:hypothetical protein
MKKIAVILLLVLLLTMLAIPAFATDTPSTPSLTAPPKPTMSANQLQAASNMPENLGSVIGIALAGVMVVAVVVIVIVQKRK